MQQHHQVLIAGGGTAGITIAARLARLPNPPSIAIIEPSDKHYYQPFWTLVGGGLYDREVTERDEAGLIPSGVEWVRDRVAAFDPDRSSVELEGGDTLTYDHLVVALGIKIDWDGVKGLREAVGTRGVCTNYSYDHVPYTWELIDQTREGNAVFTFPATPIKCGGAPQKIMYLAEEHFRRAGVRDAVNVVYMASTASIFGIPKYRASLERIVAERGIDARFRQNLVELRADAKEAVFHHLDTGEETVLPYAMIHVTPPQAAPDVIARSALANETGWVEVDDHTLRHTRFENVWSAGDCSSVPAAKTGAAVRKQAPVLVANLDAARRGEPPPARYDGYASCPLVTGRGKVILAEFGYDGEVMETFPFDQSKERWSMYALKAYALPPLYWHGMLRGRA